MHHDVSAYFWCYDSLGLFDPSLGVWDGDGWMYSIISDYLAQR